VYTYPGTDHAFHNDTTPRFNKAAAALAWQRTVAHFNKYLKTA
jgi:carboxymethylenebutenolidase